MKRFKSIVLAALALLVLTAYVPAQPASAQSASLSIAPKKNYVIEPGDSVSDKLTIRNLDANNALTLNLSVIDFTYTDNGGTPKLILDKNVDPTTWSLKPYMTIPDSVTVDPGQSKSVDLSVDIPSKLGAGSYYSAIIYSTGAPDGGNVGLAASGVTLAFVTVPGTVKEDLTLKKFGAYDKTAKGDLKGYKFLMTTEPSVIGYTLENKGNVVEAPVGTIKLKSMFGQEYTINEVNPSRSLALIGQTRTFNACIKLQSQDVNFKGTDAEAETCASAGLWPGLYTATAQLYYGQNGNYTREINGAATFWYLPLWFIVIFLILLLILAFYIWRTVVWIRGGSFKLRGTPRGAGRRRASRRR